MLKLMLSIMIFLASFMTSISHPLSLSLMILIQSMMICLVARMLTNSSWIPLTIFLMVVGGLMIMFIYTTSICSNKKFKYLNMKKVPWVQLLILMPTIFYSSSPYKFYDSVNSSDLFNMEFIKMFFMLNISSSMFVFLYLLITLIIMISIMNINKGPMRKKY
uniref:NADH dehydrogenase subunit 6 n=1 Tax=Euphyllura phillyreae TaxID=2008460 RepID=A0A344A2B5_9HEMI|nr:NADH dehydrogenase subunit 6 [Euphyllura phillyreae]AWU48906.1 NADH dehydrogenase subunit 6 [Euphyllura phillyreae]